MSTFGFSFGLRSIYNRPTVGLRFVRFFFRFFVRFFVRSTFGRLRSVYARSTFGLRSVYVLRFWFSFGFSFGLCKIYVQFKCCLRFVYVTSTFGFSFGFCSVFRSVFRSVYVRFVRFFVRSTSGLRSVYYIRSKYVKSSFCLRPVYVRSTSGLRSVYVRSTFKLHSVYVRSTSGLRSASFDLRSVYVKSTSGLRSVYVRSTFLFCPERTRGGLKSVCVENSELSVRACLRACCTRIPHCVFAILCSSTSYLNIDEISN